MRSSHLRISVERLPAVGLIYHGPAAASSGKANMISRANDERLNRKTTLVLFLLAAIGVVVLLIATRFGIGISPDSVTYIDAARSLSHGNGLSALSAAGELRPLTHYPPLYSSLLALIGAGGAELPAAARWLNAILFGAIIFLTGFMTRKCARASLWLPLLVACLTLMAPDLAGIHSFALTEPLFIFLTMTGLLCLARYVENRQYGFLIASSLTIALAFLTRYVGVVSVFAGVIALTVFSDRSIRRRLIDVLAFGAITCAPMALWAVRNQRLAEHATDRQLVFHPVKSQQLLAGLSTVSSWLLLGKVRVSVRAVVFLIEVGAALAFVIYLWRKRERTQTASRGDTTTPLPHILIVFVVCYAAFLVFTASFIDADTVFDGRSLAPIHVAMLVMVPCLVRKLYLRSKRTRTIRIVFVALALVFAGSYAVRGVKWLARVRGEGQGYSSRTWKESPTIARIKTLPAATIIYSNGYDAIYYLTDRRARLIPEKVIHGTGRPNAMYDPEMARMKIDLLRDQGVLVYFYTLPERQSLPSEIELEETLKLRPIAKSNDGTISVVNR